MYTFSMYILACSPMFRLGSCITDHDREIFLRETGSTVGEGDTACKDGELLEI